LAFCAAQADRLIPGSTMPREGSVVLEPGPLIIACATDSRFAELAGALLRSIAVNGDVPEAEIVVCGDGLSEREKLWLTESASGLKIRFIDVRGAHRARIADFHTTRHETTSTFTRLLLPDLLSEVTGRILYLDVDMIVNRSLRPLFEIPLNGHPIGAVQNPGDLDRFARFNRRVGRPPDGPNINAGLLVIDLDKWREFDIADRCFEVLTWAPNMIFADQDAINAVLGDRVELLDRTWNFYANDPRSFTRDEYCAANIIHFVSWMKPNLVECSHPARDVFLMHRACTLWRDAPLMTHQIRGITRLFMLLVWKLSPRRGQPRPATQRDMARAAVRRSNMVDR
jgi:lipopolysaccharide biosynthesis glycosyltransferase